MKQIHHEELEDGDKERSGAFPKIMLKETDSGIQRIQRTAAILRAAYRRLCEQWTPQESWCGLRFQRIGPGNRSQRQANSRAYVDSSQGGSLS